MQELQIKSAKLASQAERKEQVLESILLPFEHLPGSVFGVLFIEGQLNEHRAEMAAIIFEQLQLLQAIEASANVPRRFEQLLQQINQELQVLQQKNPKVQIEQLHAILGTRVKNQLFLSGTGFLHALFMHRTAQQRYSIYQLDKQLQEGEFNPEKPFITVLDGELHPGDVFYLSTPLDPKEISIGELQDILVTLPPSGALKRIEQHVHRDKGYAAVAFQIQEPETQTTHKKINPLSSITELTQTQEKTTALLSEQGTDVVGRLQKMAQPLMKKLASPGKNDTKSVLKRIAKMLVKALLFVTSVTVSIVKTILTAIKKAIELTKEKRSKSAVSNDSDATLPQTDEASDSTKRSVFQKIAALSTLQKYAIGGVILLIISIVIVLLFAFSGNKQKNPEIDINETARQIEEQINAAEASLIYGDQEQAQSFLTQARALLDSIEKKEKNQEAIAQLEQSIETIEAKARGITMPELTELQGLSATLGNAPASNIIYHNNTVFVTSETNTVASFSELNNSWINENVTIGSIAASKRLQTEGANILVLDDQNRLGRANITAKTLNPLVSGTQSLTDVQDIFVYNSSVYALTNTTKQVIRMRAQGENYEAGTSWITATTEELGELRSLAIDGSVYILGPDKVYEFLSGSQQAFAITNLEPALANATKIWTNEASNHLYILEAEQKRIVVLDKSGVVVSQYQHNELQNALDFTVNEAGNTIYFTTENNAYAFTAEHLL